MIGQANGQQSCPATYFAAPERAAEADLLASAQVAQNDLLLHAIASCVDGILMILNRYRQVLAVNETTLRALGVSDVQSLLGRRPGEAIDCIHVPEGPGGCGTAKACRTCGAVLAILASQAEGRPSEQECLATVHRDGHTESLEFRVRATPMDAGGEPLTALVLNDISGQKRREALERVFFHDILNTIGGLMGWASALHGMDGLDLREGAGHIADLSRRLAEEVKEQRRLVEAERGELALTILETPVADILEELRTLFELHPAAQGKHLILPDVQPADRIRTDAPLLMRVLTNMVKNAFEAVDEGATVFVKYERAGDAHTFRVRNPGVIPELVQDRIFNRSFSTKGGPGRGLGTYSMKLFGERYLGGQVGFESTAEQGTTFYIRLPSAR